MFCSYSCRFPCTKTAVLFNDIAMWVEIRLTDCEQRLRCYQQSSIEHEDLLNCLPKALVFGPAYLASGSQGRNSVLMERTNDSELQMAAGDRGS